jgi:hypothetical protein
MRQLEIKPDCGYNLFAGAASLTAMFKGFIGQFAEAHISSATVRPGPIQDQI